MRKQVVDDPKDSDQCIYDPYTSQWIKIVRRVIAMYPQMQKERHTDQQWEQDRPKSLIPGYPNKLRVLPTLPPCRHPVEKANRKDDEETPGWKERIIRIPQRK